MNYDVMCFGDVDGSIRVVHHEYFETYKEALEFEKTQTEYEWGVSITPMNETAEKIMCNANIKVLS